MTINPYFRLILGESAERVARLHQSSISRMKAFAIAIHIPIALWAVTGYIIASQTFGLDTSQSALVSAFCSVIVYMVERLVLATPKGWGVNALRIFIGLLMAILGASTVDLVIFEREVQASLQKSAEINLRTEHDLLIEQQTSLVNQRRSEWMTARDAANCEANGTCGSKIRSLGPIYQQLSSQAEPLRKDYLKAADRLEALKNGSEQELAKLRNNGVDTSKAGLLSRIESLHQYTMNNKAALSAWMVFFLLILFFELMVVLVKLMFGETVDDVIERVRESVNTHKAIAYQEAMTSPLLNARQLIDNSYA